MTPIDLEMLDPAKGPRRGSSEPVLSLRDLKVTFRTEEGIVQAVRGVDMDVYEHEVLGVVGESGSGKSVTMLAVLGLLPRTARITGSAKFRGQELIGANRKLLRTVRGANIAMIFQDPLTALNPVHKVGSQLSEALLAHDSELSRSVAATRAVELLDQVGIPQAGLRARQYPHEFSGGMRQRAMIAIAIANQPDVLIADEPTTALDVTIQAQILELLQEIQRETGTAIVFITHDLGVIAKLAGRVQVMYAGRAVELGDVDSVFQRSTHPYTRGLLSSLPALETRSERLHPIAGTPPSMLNPPPGCAFHPRCPMRRPICETEEPELRAVGSAGQLSRCHFADELAAEW